nr:unnamed protein product [Callosobruchus chinensis]
MFDAYGKIYRYEGFTGLYRGFWVSSVQIISGVFYISTYEGARHILKQQNVNSNVRALAAGAAASLVGQTIIVPFDVLSQHLMMMGVNGREEKVQRIGSMRCAFRDLWVEEGLKMFSKGLSARLIQSATFSCSIIIGYETIKRISVNDEYKKFIKW